MSLYGLPPGPYDLPPLQMRPGEAFPGQSSIPVPPDAGPYPGAELEQPMPDDFWSRMAGAAGPEPFKFQSKPGRAPNAAEIVLGLAAVFGNMKAGQAAKKIGSVEEKNKLIRDSASAMAKQRWELKKQRENRASIEAMTGLREQGADNRRVPVTMPDGSVRNIEAGAVTGSVKGDQPTGISVPGGAELLGKNRPPPPRATGGGGAGSGYSGFDPDVVADGIAAGMVAPNQSGYSRGQWGAISTSLRKRHPNYNLMKSAIDLTATSQFYRTSNQNAQVRLRQASANANKTVRFVRELVGEIQAAAPPRTPVTAINKFGLAAIKNGALGPKAAAAATKLGAQIAALKLEMPNVYSGGYAAQEMHLKHTDELIDQNWSIERILAGLDIAEADTRMRIEAVNEAGAMTPSTPLNYTGEPQGEINIGPNPMRVGSGAASGTVKMQKGGKTYNIPAADVAEAERDGLVRVP